MDTGPRPPGGMHASDEDIAAYSKRWAIMTPAEKLREGARELGINV